jgi:signal transduction histidine kinase
MARSADGQVRVLVSDTGIGIENQQMPQIFEARQDNRPSSSLSPQKFAGLGIRLPLVKQLVAANQGSIWVESHPGQGTTFTFALPLVQ